jgi:DNA invertase Pin-like site-specific DNA recombinase
VTRPDTPEEQARLDAAREHGRAVLRDQARRGVIYARISKDSKQGSGLGVGKQVEDCQALAERLGIDVVGVREDNDLTAFKGGSRSKPRRGYSDLLDDIRSGRADVVLAWHTDRLHRDMTELEDYITVCGEGRNGVPTNTVKGGDLDLSTSSGRMVARILGAVARQEVEHMIERIRSSKQRSRKAGAWSGGPRPFGYRPDGPSVKQGGEGALAQVPAEAAALRDAYATVLALDPKQGLTTIARDWNARGLRTPEGGSRGGGNPWRPHTVRARLLSPTSAGIIEYQGEVIGPANWEPVVDVDTWRTARAILTDPKRRTTPGPASRHLLSGVLICGVCGGRLFRVVVDSRHRHGRRTMRTYQCHALHYTPAADLPEGLKRMHLARDADRLEEFVEQIVVERLRRPDVVAALNTRPEVDIPALEKRRMAINAELQEIAEARFTVRQKATMSEPLLDELDQIDSLITEALRGDALPEFRGKDPGEAWAGLKAAGNVARMRAIVMMLLRVKLLPAGKGGNKRGARMIDGRFPFNDKAVEILPPDA